MKDTYEFRRIIEELLKNKRVQEMKKYRQHFNRSCYEHCFFVAYVSYKIAKKLGWDYKSITRAAMLHDFFLYDWRKDDGWHKWHAFKHGKFALKNAIKEFNLTDQEKDMIKKHMWPVTIIPPRTKEGFLLTFIDKYCALMELVR